MTNPICRHSVVMVVRPSPCCGDTSALGRIFEVRGIRPSGSYCSACKTQSDGPSASRGGADVALASLVNLDVRWGPSPEHA